MRKTKIICTLGPSTDKDGVLRELVANGMNVARFNFSHGSYEEHKGRLDMLKAVRCHTDSCTWPTGKIPCCGTKAEKSCGSKLFHLLLYPLGYNRARKTLRCG